MSAKSDRRSYDNSRRRELAAATRQRIVDAGCSVVRESDLRDWRGLTVVAAAQRAGVSERTVYRHLSSELGLREAVMDAMEQQAGIDLDHLTLDGVAEAAQRIFAEVAGFAAAAPSEAEPVLQATGARQREALLAAVSDVATQWSEPQQVAAAAVLDVLWSPAALERLRTNWQLTPETASQSLAWAVRVVEQAVRTGAPVDIATNSK